MECMPFSQFKCHGWPQPWLPRVQKLAAPSAACENAAFEGNHLQACQGCTSVASAGGAWAAPPLWPPFKAKHNHSIDTTEWFSHGPQPLVLYNIDDC
jgi:hypothetical protein